MRRRLQMDLHGLVQGVGFRPFVYRLARELELAGSVSNDGHGVHIELEGSEQQLAAFRARLHAEKPPHALILEETTAWAPSTGDDDFVIRPSAGTESPTALVVPDLATCADCSREVMTATDRRLGYPFTNCTNCGPRFSIIRSLPYDRAHTTMARFRMCPACQREYDDPGDRRFHAQPNACPSCGPRLALWDPDGGELDTGASALARAARALGLGSIVALKGLGGFHLLVDATNEQAVATLRARKRRPHKPLALMVHDLAETAALCEVSAGAARALQSAAAPILLLPARRPSPVAANVAPGVSTLGVMLPYTPLHQLLFARVTGPLVATSGNLSEEPICIDEVEAKTRLRAIADLLLVHDRPIARHVDDSVAFEVAGEVRPLRRARGMAPLPVVVSAPLPCVLAVGAEQKSTVALSQRREVFLSQHIGDLETPESQRAFVRVIEDLLALYRAEPVALAHDLHPDYASTRWARGDDEAFSAGGVTRLQGIRRVGVQHHHAHLAACLADNQHPGRALGVTWDGTGYGPDGTVWGGELLLGDARAVARVGTLRRFRLPGGDAAIREPWRVALALLWELHGEEALTIAEGWPWGRRAGAARGVLAPMMRQGLRSPWTTSAGRLFDAVAALCLDHDLASYEGQAAIALEASVDSGEPGAYPTSIIAGGRETESTWVVDWGPLVEALLDDRRRGVAPGRIAARFHRGLVEAMVSVAERVGETCVALSGGCFQNRFLCETAVARLVERGFAPLLHRHTPPNDGCISLGQVLVASAQLG